VTGPDGTDSQADSASSILVTRSKAKQQVKQLFLSPGLAQREPSDTVRAISPVPLGRWLIGLVLQRPGRGPRWPR
jgi:hypothetical protein